MSKTSSTQFILGNMDMLLEAILAEQPFYQHKYQPQQRNAEPGVDEKLPKHQKMLQKSKESERVKSSPTKDTQPTQSLSPSSKMMTKLEEEQNQMVKILIEQIATSNNFQQSIQPAATVGLKHSVSGQGVTANNSSADSAYNAFGYFGQQQQQQKAKEVNDLAQVRHVQLLLINREKCES